MGKEQSMPGKGFEQSNEEKLRQEVLKRLRQDYDRLLREAIDGYNELARIVSKEKSTRSQEDIGRLAIMLEEIQDFREAKDELSMDYGELEKENNRLEKIIQSIALLKKGFEREQKLL